MNKESRIRSWFPHLSSRMCIHNFTKRFMELKDRDFFLYTHLALLTCCQVSKDTKVYDIFKMCNILDISQLKLQGNPV